MLCLLCALRDGGRYCQRTFILTQRSFLFLFWPVDTPFRKQPHGLNEEKRVNRKNATLEVDVATWPLGRPPPTAFVHPGSPSARSSVSRVRLSARGPCSTFLSPSGPSEGPLPGCCLTRFSLIQGQDQFYIPIHLQVKWHFAALPGVNAAVLWRKERHWIKQRGGWEGKRSS